MDKVQKSENEKHIGFPVKNVSPSVEKSPSQLEQQEPDHKEVTVRQEDAHIKGSQLSENLHIKEKNEDLPTDELKGIVEELVGKIGDNHMKPTDNKDVRLPADQESTENLSRSDADEFLELDYDHPMQFKSESQQMAAIKHASGCARDDCIFRWCVHLKPDVQHLKKHRNAECDVCMQILKICCWHVKECQQEGCPVPFCENIRRKISEEKAALNAGKAGNSCGGYQIRKHRGRRSLYKVKPGPSSPDYLCACCVIRDPSLSP